MSELTEQQEKDLIAAAKTGDPEANYQLSMWALDRAREEPEEPRWNRLAAKCLLRAADAGHEKAKAAMQQLLQEQGSQQAAPSQPQQAPQAQAPQQEAQSTARDPFAAEGDPYAQQGGEEEGRSYTRQKKQRQPRSGGISLGAIASWTDEQWKKVQVISIAVAVVLALLIIILVATSNRAPKADKTAEETAQTEVETVEATTAPTPTPEPEGYPDESTKEEIAAQSLDVVPEDGDYVSEATTGTVSTSGSNLRMRSGPSTDYSIVKEISDGSSVNIYAEKDGWYFFEYSGSWGWGLSDYVEIDEAADTEADVG